MLTYGYILSNLPRHERFNEAQLLLDKMLRGYTKDNPIFEDDGTITVVYRKGGESESKVILKRNVTESHIAVYSDKPLKLLRLGGIMFYVRDIIPTVLYFLYYIFITKNFHSKAFFSGSSRNMLLIFVFGPLITVLLLKLTRFFIRKNRSSARIRFIQCGGVISIAYILAYMLRLTGQNGIWNFWVLLLRNTPMVEVVGGLMLSILFDKLRRDKY